MIKNEMMKQLIILIGLVVITSIDLFAQQLPLYSQYNLNPFLYNPARTGENDRVQLYLMYRRQWVDFKGAPETRALSIDGTVKEKIGLGGYIYSDYTDIIERFGGQFSYAYRFSFGEHKLGLGIAAGIQEVRVDFSRVTVDDPDEPLLTGNFQKGLSFDASAGIGYWFKGLHVGFSVPQVFETDIKHLNNDDRAGYQLARHYLASASYDVEVIKDNFYIEPGVMFRMSKGKAYQIDVNALFRYKEIAWLSATYRYDYAVTVGGGVRVHDRLAVGYSYDFSVNKLSNFSGGTHEIVLGVHFGKKEDKGLIEAV